MMERARIIVKGRVQKAGYMDFIDEVVFNLDLKGRARNLEDGAVEVICEGNKEDIETLIQKIRIDQYPIRVEDINVEYSKATGEFKEFEIVREEDVTQATYERMDTAARYMREMNTNLGEKIDSGFAKTGQNFQTLREDYGKISQTIEKILEQMTQQQKEFTDAINGLTKAILALAEKKA